MLDLASSVTVVIPVWDRYVRVLPEAVLSVADDAPEVRIVVVDNASVEPVPQLPGTEVLRIPNRVSAGAARNAGLRAVRTEHVVMLDADDRVLPGALAFLSGRLAADPSLSVVVTSILDGATGRRHRSPRRFVERLVRRPRLFASLNCVWSLLPIQGCAMFRADQARQAGGYGDADSGEDWVLAVSLAFRGRVELHGRLGLYYRPTAESLSAQARPSSDLVTSSRLVRERVRADPSAPALVRSLGPVLALLQLSALFGARPVYRTAAACAAACRGRARCGQST